VSLFRLPDFDLNKRSRGEYALRSIMPEECLVPSLRGKEVWYDNSRAFIEMTRGWYRRPFFEAWTDEPEEASGASYIAMAMDLVAMFNNSDARCEGLSPKEQAATLVLLGQARIVLHPARKP
jgi:hypothetical protein